MKTFNVVIATSGRDTLQTMIDSIAPQLTGEDYLTIIWDSQPIGLQINSDCKVITIQNENALGFWGHASRSRWQNSLPGDYIINGDDDDVFTSDAMSTIREHCIEDKLYVFRMEYSNTTIPNYHAIAYGNIGTPCGVYKPGNLPEWPLEYGGDFKFYQELSKTKDPVFIDKTIYKIRP
jgi:hypothetical protein